MTGRKATLHFNRVYHVCPSSALPSVMTKLAASSTLSLALTYCSSISTFPIPSIFALTFSHVFCLSQRPTAYPICPILCPSSPLPAGHRQRLPEGRTGVATHTPLSTGLPVASGRACTQRWANGHRHRHKGTLIRGCKTAHTGFHWPYKKTYGHARHAKTHMQTKQVSLKVASLKRTLIDTIKHCSRYIVQIGCKCAGTRFGCHISANKRTRDEHRHTPMDTCNHKHR